MSKFIVNDIKIISSWGYNLQSNTDCTICRCSLDTSSLYNQDKGIDSKIINGICGHAFHEECINPWINKNKNCPICFSKWTIGTVITPLNYIESNTSSLNTTSPSYMIPPLVTMETITLNSSLSNINLLSSVSLNSSLSYSIITPTVTINFQN
jgi:hypothetical protein